MSEKVEIEYEFVKFKDAELIAVVNKKTKNVITYLSMYEGGK